MPPSLPLPATCTTTITLLASIIGGAAAARAGGGAATINDASASASSSSLIASISTYLTQHIAQKADWSGLAKSCMYPVSNYLWLFPDDVRSGEALTAAQNGIRLFPSSHHLLYGLWVALFLCILRFLLDWLVFVPLAKRAMKLTFLLSTHTRRRIKALDAAFTLSPFPPTNKQEMETLAAHTPTHTHDEVHAYYRRRRQEANEEKKVVKFKEACWRDLLYITACTLACVCVVPQSWFWDIKECWRAYPLQDVPSAVVFYYIFQLGIYLHLSAYQFIDTKRSDFWEMFIHHAATIFLIVFSWLSCFVRIGTLVMLIHDWSDVFLETAKIFNYTSRARPWAQGVTDQLFICFAVTFFVTRLVVYPFWIVKSTLTDAHYIIGGKYFGMYMFYAMLFVLQFLHVFWFYLIARMAVKMIISGKVEKDVRSDDEEEEEEEGEEEEKKEQHQPLKGKKGYTYTHTHIQKVKVNEGEEENGGGGYEKKTQ